MAPRKASTESSKEGANKRTRQTKSAAATPRGSIVSSTNTTITTTSSAVTSPNASKVSSSISKVNGTTASKAKPGAKATTAKGPPMSALARARAISAAKGDSMSPTKATATTQGKSAPSAKRTKPKATAKAKEAEDSEALKAFLRIRPAPQDALDQEPYIQVLSETEVLMAPPKNPSISISASRARAHASVPPTKYAFSRVFPGESSVSQSSFFRDTTLPMVDDLLQGESGLVFTYGVTNSGKSYTVQGDSGPGQAGILPRSMDVIFNSIKGLESDSDIRPYGFSGVELVPPEDAARQATGSRPSFNPFSLPSLSRRLVANDKPLLVHEHDDTSVKVDRNYRYSVWVSYVEVYNEKIFDLLDAAPPSSSSGGRSSSMGMTRSNSQMGSNWSLFNTANAPGDGPIMLQRRPLALKNDIEAGTKYLAGLREIKVSSAQEAQEILRRGQENRAVFGTMANRASSRSHSVFTVKIIRQHAGEMAMLGPENDASAACSVSRLSIVDLAGSERLGNSAATGDRLKETGNINKSLMCLGQCLETLRKNQQRMAAPIHSVALSSAATGGGGARSALNAIQSSSNSRRRPSLVPFRHSKLTELFQSFFTGEGKAVMIVNANPYDTGFDENSHVMRFSANAKEVQTTVRGQPTGNLGRFVHPSLRNLIPTPKASPAKSQIETETTSSKKGARAVSNGKKEAKEVTKKDAVASEKPTNGKKASSQQKPEEAEITIFEVESISEEGLGEEGDDDETDGFVDHLMSLYEEVRAKLHESELRCAQIETEVREEMAEEMGARLLEMENVFHQRILTDAEHNEDFVNRKLDLLVQANKGEHERMRKQFETPRKVINPSLSDDEEGFDEEEEDGEVSESLGVQSRSIDEEQDDISEAEEDEDEEMHEPDSLAERSNERIHSEAHGDSIDEDSQVESEDEEIAPEENTDESAAVYTGEEDSEEEEDEDEESEEEDDDEEEDDFDEEDESFSLTKEDDEDASEEEDGDSSFESEAPKKKRVSTARKSAVATPKSKPAVPAAKKQQQQQKQAAKGPFVAAPMSDVTSRRANETASLTTLDFSDTSDADLVVEKNSPSKKKRALGKAKRGIDEEEIMDRVGDSSLVEAMQRSNSTRQVRSISSTARSVR